MGTKTTVTSLMAVAFVNLATKTPCCGAPTRLRATNFVPLEKYSRECKKCGTKWEIERRTSSQGEHRRVDLLDWEEQQ